MAYVVTENCINCKHTTCVEVCPADAFREGANFLVIDPDDCVDCNMCVPECPVDAIFSEDNLPKDQIRFIELNAELAQRWPVISEPQPAMKDFEGWDGVSNKLKLLELE